MKNKVTRVTILIVIASQCMIFSASGKPQIKTESHLLPWVLIAEKFDGGSQFCSSAKSDNDCKQPKKDDMDKSSDSGVNYVFQSNAVVTVKLPPGKFICRSSEKIIVGLAKWSRGSWQQIGEIIASIISDELKLNSEIQGEGFFRLQFSPEVSDERQANFETYVIVSDNWKKDILVFCRKLKEDIEINSDPKLIFSSIAVSHFDHAMEVVSRSSFLSGKILQALADAVGNKKKFDNGQCPDLVVGLNKIRLKRFEGAQIAEFVVFIPENYDDSRKWPLLLHPDPMRFNVRSNYSKRSGLIDVWWHFTFPMGFEWKDYKRLLSTLKSKLNLDEDRIYIYGFCGNGFPAMALALNYPDQWAECSIALGNKCCNLAGNALNIPFIFVRGVHIHRGWDSKFATDHYNFALKCFLYHGSRNFRYAWDQSIEDIRGKAVPDEVRENNPQRVSYTIETLDNPAAYWVKINGREDENLNGTIDASVDGQAIYVMAKNVDAYSLDLVQAPVDSNKPVEIIENGQSLGFVTDQIFSRKSEKYIGAAYIKNEHLHGPVADVFTDAYVVVYGTSSEETEFVNCCKKTAKKLAGDAPCIEDKVLPKDMLNNHNLILVGTAKSNSWMSKISDGLPIKVTNGKVVANGVVYDSSNVGFIVTYPNPINPEKYVLVFSTTSQRAMANISKAFSGMSQSADVGIFEVTENGRIKWHIMEKFNTVWGWHNEWNEVMAVATKKHPEWQWRQWVARTIREQLEADVVICGNPFRFGDSIAAGQITCRDLFKSFRNDWIVKIRLSGKSLRELLTVSVDHLSKRPDATLTIDGLSFVKIGQDSEGTELVVNELENDKKYTVALRYTFVNGRRTGIVLNDYQIVAEGYSVPLLKDYLCKNKSLDLDSQLDSMRFNMF